jgi:tripartite-type tricarboxylate transporter receptor subunit TctC
MIRGMVRLGMRRSTCAVMISLAAALAFASGTASAQTYPSQPIRLVLGLPPGGAADVVARLVGQALEQRLGQPVVIENKPGSGSNIAADFVAKSAPDGYTLMVAPDSLVTINPHLYRTMPIDPLKDLVPVSSLVRNQLVLAISPTLDVKDVRDFVALAKRSDPPLFYSSFGNGTQSHLAMELLKQQTKMNLVHVPYRGGVAAAMAVMAKDVSANFGGGGVFSMVMSGRLRALGVAGPKRMQQIPDVPSISEFYPDYQTTLWQGLFAPAGTPQPIIGRLRGAVLDLLSQQAFADKLIATGSGEPYVSTPAEFAAQIDGDYQKYGALIRSIGAKID